MPASRSTTNASATAAPKALTLNFDPRYVEFLIQAWLARDFAPVHLDDLIAATAGYAEEAFRTLNVMGLPEETVSNEEIKRAITLFITLGLAKQKRVTPKPPKPSKRGNPPQLQSTPAPLAPPYSEVTVTPDGCDLMTQPKVTGALRPGIIHRIVAQSPGLAALLRSFHEHGPLARPVRSLTPFAPTRGALYTQEVEAGIQAFWAEVDLAKSRAHAVQPTSPAKKPTAAKLIDIAAAEALQRHPAGSLKQLDKLIDIASELGIVWCDATQVNDVIAARWVGSAAISIDGGFTPNTSTWDEIGPRFLKALMQAHTARADGTGFVTVTSLRGVLGRTLGVSAPVVDAFLCQARADGDQRRSAVTLHFEPDEDATYASNRRPLIWNGRAYDQVLVTYPSSMQVANVMARQASN